MPWDRVWAIAHEASRIEPDSTKWAPCANFSRGAKSPALMAVRAKLAEDTGILTLTHPDLDAISVNPDDTDDAARLIDWVLPISNPDRARPAFVVRAADRAMTDSDFPSISILSQSSLHALSQAAGNALAMERFRGNIWLEGLAPWEEFDWLGREIRVGKAVLKVRERIARCRATQVDTSTGKPDTDTLGLLETGWGHQDFGVYGEVVSGGQISVGDKANLL